MTAVYYVMDGDNEIHVSTMAERAKAKVVRRDGRVSLCVLDESWPLTYLQVYGHARLDEDFETAMTVLRRVLEVMAGQPMPDSTRPDVERMVRDGYFDYQWLDHEIYRTIIVGDCAVVVGRMTGDVIVNGSMRHLNSAALIVWARRSYGWRLLAFQPTPLKS